MCVCNVYFVHIDIIYIYMTMVFTGKFVNLYIYILHILYILYMYVYYVIYIIYAMRRLIEIVIFWLL